MRPAALSDAQRLHSTPPAECVKSAGSVSSSARPHSAHSSSVGVKPRAETMRHAFELEVPLVVGVEVGKNWAELEPYGQGRSNVGEKMR